MWYCWEVWAQCCHVVFLPHRARVHNVVFVESYKFELELIIYCKSSLILLKRPQIFSNFNLIFLSKIQFSLTRLYSQNARSVADQLVLWFRHCAGFTTSTALRRLGLSLCDFVFWLKFVLMWLYELLIWLLAQIIIHHLIILDRPVL